MRFFSFNALWTHAVPVFKIILCTDDCCRLAPEQKGVSKILVHVIVSVWIVVSGFRLFCFLKSLRGSAD